MMKEADLYIIILRYGKDKLSDGFQVPSFIKYLNENGYPEMSEYNTFLVHYFDKLFFSKDGTLFPHYSTFFYLRPECYSQLLEYDSMHAARKEAKEARRYAIVALVLNIIAILIAIFK